MEFILEEIFDAPARAIYEAWLDSEGHTQMTGAEAECSNQIGGKFMAWDGYISGQNLELIPGKLIRQNWRTTEFETDQPDSIVEITFSDLADGKTRVSIKHTNLNEQDFQYKQGWEDFYFTPMKDFFNC